MVAGAEALKAHDCPSFIEARLYGRTMFGTWSLPSQPQALRQRKVEPSQTHCLSSQLDHQSVDITVCSPQSCRRHKNTRKVLELRITGSKATPLLSLMVHSARALLSRIQFWKKKRTAIHQVEIPPCLGLLLASWFQLKQTWACPEPEWLSLGLMYCSGS